jgi:hypothetical protein
MAEVLRDRAAEALETATLPLVAGPAAHPVMVRAEPAEREV